ncbi:MULTISPECIES: ankyrin repeat domain-containing protein [Dermabacter]|uniref:ankyrin repeat domain-containing protein n=1 Tax=Dermabacter TaxID=36739 RepID=UPI000774D2EB|nr:MULTISPECIES: ankyrin repeat domain-containing protein [Dermabacter]MCT1867342.1 ankyrin repeat domain-containing protein [Dermabacter sp. p3-SID358]MCT2024490.1 ankyrin repeat domain-containing protein [Dermabacter hominis]
MSDNTAPQPGTDADEAAALARALMDAAREGNLDILRPAIEAGIPLNMQDADGNTMLMLAAYHDHAALVKLLAEHGADVDLLNDRGQSPLAGAVFKGFDDVVAVLVEAGADPDAGVPSARESARFFSRAYAF